MEWNRRIQQRRCDPGWQLDLFGLHRKARLQWLGGMVPKLCRASNRLRIKACVVSPGDVFYVVTYGTSGTATQTVYEEDTTQGWYITASLPWVSGPGLIGNSEEQVVERPCCVTVGSSEDDYALNHYNYEWFGDAQGEDGHETAFYAGEQTTSTYLLTMYDDSGTIAISYVEEQGSAGNAGKYSLMFSDENCAYTGGCTP